MHKVLTATPISSPAWEQRAICQFRVDISSEDFTACLGLLPSSVLFSLSSLRVGVANLQKEGILHTTDY